MFGILVALVLVERFESLDEVPAQERVCTRTHTHTRGHPMTKFQKKNPYKCLGLKKSGPRSTTDVSPHDSLKPPSSSHSSRSPTRRTGRTAAGARKIKQVHKRPFFCVCANFGILLAAREPSGRVWWVQEKAPHIRTKSDGWQ